MLDRQLLAMLLQSGALSALLVIASYTDIKKRIIPDIVCILIALSSLVYLELTNLLGVFSALPFLVAALICDGFGGGDVKLMAATGLVLGLMDSIFAMIIALSVELVFYLLYWFFQDLKGRECIKTLPLAPFLTVGVLAVYFLF